MFNTLKSIWSDTRNVSKRRWWWLDFKTPLTRDSALGTLRGIGAAFYGLAIFQLVITLVVFNALGGNWGFFLDVVLFLALGYCIRNFQSRGGSVAAVLYGVVTLLITFDNLIKQFSGGKTSGGTIVLALMVLIYSAQAVRASFAYHRMSDSRLNIRNVIIKNLLALIYAACSGFAFLVVVAALRLNAGMVSQETLGTLLLLAVLTPVGLTYRGWLPFTSNRPFVIYPVDSTMDGGRPAVS